MTSFRVAGETYFPITLPNGEIYTRVIVNRVANPVVADLDRQTLFFQTNAAVGNTRYFGNSYTRIQEAINRRIVNRGSDNIFANTGGSTNNNVERIDLLFDGGVFTPLPLESGFLISERGGNDNIKVAAITGLSNTTGTGVVTSLGNLVDVTTSDWGGTGQNIATTVFQKFSTDAEMRPSQNLGSQQIYGVFINFDDLGVDPFETIYGIAVFPNDVNATMDLVGLTDVPLATVEGNGGLDMMGGGGFFATDNVAVTDIMVNLEVLQPSVQVGDVITLRVRVDNNGPFNDVGLVTTTTIPAGYTFDGIVPGFTGTTSVTGNVITWNFSSLDAGEFENLDIRVVVEPAGGRLFESEVSGTLTDVVLANNNDELLGLLSAGEIDAINDDYSALPVNGPSGGSPGNALDNDLLGGLAVNSADVSISVIFTDGLAGVTISADGTVNVPPNTLSGTYDVEYRICELASPSNCDNAIITIVVEEGSCPAPPSSDLTRVQSAVGTGTSATATFASTPTEGNLLVAIAGYRTNIDGTPDGNMVNSGWTRRVNNRSNFTSGGFDKTGIAIFTKIAGASEPTAVTTNWTAAREHTLIIQEFAVPNENFYDIIYTSASAANSNGNYVSSIGSGNAGNNLNKIVFAVTGVIGGNNTDININYNNSFSNALLETPGISPSMFLGTSNRNFFSTNNNVNLTATFVDASNAALFKVASIGIVTFEVRSISSPPDGAILSVNPQACDNPTGSIEVTSPLGADFEYTINNGVSYQASPLFNNLSFGSYFVRVRNVNTGCLGPPERADLIPAICANDDTFPTISTSGGDVGIVLTNDEINGNPISNLADLNGAPTVINDGGLTGVTIAANGTLNVPNGTPRGTYNVEYEICLASAPTVCDRAIATINVVDIDAVNDDLTASPVNGYIGGTIGSVHTNDLLGGLAVNSTDINTIIIDNDGITGLSINSSGTFTVPAATPAGTYNIEYQICEIANPWNCDVAIATILINPPSIDAVNDAAGSFTHTGANNVINIFTNDLLNVVSVIPAEVILSIPVPDPTGTLILNPNGSVDVNPNAPLGSKQLTYRICEVLNPSNCDNAVVNADITANILANNDDAGTRTVAGIANVLNVLTNDLLHSAAANSVAATAANVDISFVSESAANVFSLNTSTGSIDILPNAPTGTHTLTYRICEDGNPGNCDDAEVTVTIENGITVDIIPTCQCRNDAPYLVYNVSVNYTPVPANGTELRVRFLDANDRSFITQVVTTFKNNQRDSILWPGASVDGSGRGNNWPGWVDEGDGWFEDLSQNFGNTRPSSIVQFEINPSSNEFSVNYPPATAECATEPTSFLLPVTWLSFNGRTEGSSVHLSWSTASETNNDFFEVQRSIDGRSFEPIGYVQGMGTVNTQTNYSFIDEKPLEGYNYYQLRQVDFDGTEDYSKMVVLNMLITNEELKVFPNPTNGYFFLESGSEMLGEIIVKDISGRILMSKIIFDKTTQINFENFSSGIYFLSNTKGSTIKIIKQ